MQVNKIGISVAVVIVAAGAALAQTGRGTLTGTITDAQVTVDPGSLTVVSDAEGSFTVPALPTGEYTLSVSYAGFEPFTKKVTVVGTQLTRLRIRGVCRPAAA